MQDQTPPLGGFTQEDSYPVAREDGTGWETSKRVLQSIVADQPTFEDALRVAREWDQDNEPPWDDKLEYHLTRLWNRRHSEEPQVSGHIPYRRLSRPEVPSHALGEQIVAKYGPGAAKKIQTASLCCPNAARALDFLFPGNPWVAVGERQITDQQTFQRETLRGHESRYAWLSPNPFRQKQVKNGGVWSMRCDANVLERRHIVIEFDLKERYGWGRSIARWRAAGLSALDVHGAFFLWVATRAKLMPFMIVFGGAVSYHGWYDARELPRETLDTLVELTLPFSGDPASLVPSQLFRMPGGTRLRRINNKTVHVNQRVVFWRPYKT